MRTLIKAAALAAALSLVAVVAAPALAIAQAVASVAPTGTTVTPPEAMCSD